MLKQCVKLVNEIINIGPWDYQYIEVDGVQVAQNPLPEGAVVVEIDVFQDADGGWKATGTAVTPTIEERMQAAEDALTSLLGL